MMDDEPVLAAMERYGGSFIQALAVAWRRADDSNRLVLKTAFPAYWAQYADVAEQDSRRELRRRNGVPEPPTSIPWPQFSADGTNTECNPNRARTLAMVRNALVGLVGAWFAYWDLHEPLNCLPTTVFFCPYCGLNLNSLYADPFFAVAERFEKQGGDRR